jgi:hypothetical protein
MRRTDELHLDYPFAGSRMLMGLLQAEGHEVGRLHVSRLWQRLRGPCLVGRYLGFYNGTRPHSSLGGRTPDQAWLNQPTPIPARRHNHGGDPLSSSPDIVQTNRATSLSTTQRLPNTHCGAKERSRVPVRAPGSSSRRMDAVAASSSRPHDGAKEGSDAERRRTLWLPLGETPDSSWADYAGLPRTCA